MTLTTQIKLSLIAIFLVLALLLIVSSNARPNNELFYPVQRLQEKLFLNLQASPDQKLEFYDSLLTRRLSELEYLTYQQKTSFLWQSSLRYSATAGEITDLITNNNLKEKAPKYIGMFENHQDAINNLLKNYPGDIDPTEENSKFLTDAINYLEQYINRLSAL